MRTFFAKHKKLHIWLLADLGLLAAFWLCRGNRDWMNALAEQVTGPLRLWIGSICYRTPVSVMEGLCILAALFVPGYLLWAAVDLARKKGRRRSAGYGWCLGAVNLGLTVYLGFCFLWGVNYYTDSFQDKSGIRAEPVTVEDLQAVTVYFEQQVSAAAPLVERDENGVFAVPRQQLLPYAVHVYDRVEELFPFLTLEDPGVKPVHFSRIMSRLDFTGVYCPFTGESNVNMDSPACMLPANIAHELAHQRGIAAEQECNFLAILAATTCDDPAYNYSGWLFGYLYLSNALYRADREAWLESRQRVHPAVNADFAYHSDYWQQFRDTPVQKVSNKVYDSFLKSYGDQDGIQSYGTVVDLLVAYYR